MMDIVSYTEKKDSFDYLLNVFFIVFSVKTKLKILKISFLRCLQKKEIIVI